MRLAFGFKKSKPKVAVQLADDVHPESPSKKSRLGEHSSAHEQQSDLSRPMHVPEVIAATASTAVSESEADRFGAAININNEVRKAAVKLAEYVAKNGQSFEDVTRDRNPGDSPFSFLYYKDGDEYRFYQMKVAEISAALGIQQGAPSHYGAGSSPPPPLSSQPHIEESHLPSVPPWQRTHQYTSMQQHAHEKEHPPHQPDHPPPPWQQHDAPFGGGQGYAGTEAPPWQKWSQQQFHSHDVYRPHIGDGAPWHQQQQQQQEPHRQPAEMSSAGQEICYMEPSPSHGRVSIGGGKEDWRPGEDSRGSTDRERFDRTSGNKQVQRESSDIHDFAREPSRGHRPATGERRGRSFREQPSVDKASAPKSPARLAAEAAEAEGDTTALMNYYMNKAAQKIQSRNRESQLDPPADPRESGHSRSHGKRARASGRRTPNGGRAHHMGHHIPKEEMDKFSHECDSANNPDSAQKPWQDDSNKIGSNNKGYGLLAKMGWTEGAGLGAGGSGMVDPVSAGDVRTEKRGLGAAKSTSEVQAGDDIYEQYKKRMMLGYKHRPNPLGNPRKQYY